MTARAIVFDLDGTLLDTLDDIADSANAVLAAEGFPPHTPADYRRFIGEGVAVLFARALPEDDPEAVARCVAAFPEAYGRGWNVKTRPYDGIPALLDALTARGLPLAVLSNKPDAFTRLCVAEYLAAWEFRQVLGQRAGVPRKPDPAGAVEIAERLGVSAGDCLYVGDSAIDVETARRARMRPVGVSWGFRPVVELTQAGAEVILDRPADLLGLLE
jgi:phosphoglycolate phosphatase